MLALAAAAAVGVPATDSGHIEDPGTLRLLRARVNQLLVDLSAAASTFTAGNSTLQQAASVVSFLLFPCLACACAYCIGCCYQCAKPRVHFDGGAAEGRERTSKRGMV